MMSFNWFKRKTQKRIISLPGYHQQAKQKKHNDEFKDVDTHDWQKIMHDQLRVKNDVEKVTLETFNFDPSKPY